ncbi:MAG TPA: hypothetical protein DEP05_00970 [Betaproteobacteria bacterium]|nr:hypothetical protein [Betaproteobacteria bacterium]
MKKLIAAFLLLAGLTSVAQAGSLLRAGSAWTNQSGSTLYIQSISPSGLLTGAYINRAAGYRCQNTPYAVTGWVYGAAITFTTKWKNSTESCNSITAWTGFLYRGQIETMWQLVINGSSSTRQIIQGADTFKPASTKANKSLLIKK